MSIVGRWATPRIFLGAYDVTGDLNQTELAYSSGMLDASVFGNTTKVNSPGLMEISANVAGFMRASSATDLWDQAIFDSVGASSPVPLSIFPDNTPVEDGLAYFFQCHQANFQHGAQHGQMYGFSLQGVGGNGHQLIRGRILEPGSATRSTSGNGTEITSIGTVAAAQKLYAALHVFEAPAAGNLEVVIESDESSTFATALTRITFTQVNAAIGGQYATPVAGPIIDTHWRARWTISAGNWKFAVAVGIA